MDSTDKIKSNSSSQVTYHDIEAPFEYDSGKENSFISIRDRKENRIDWLHKVRHIIAVLLVISYILLVGYNVYKGSGEIPGAYSGLVAAIAGFYFGKET